MVLCIEALDKDSDYFQECKHENDFLNCDIGPQISEVSFRLFHVQFGP